MTPEASAVDTSFLPPTPAVDLPASLRAAVTAAAVALHTEAVTHVDLDAFVLVDADHGPHFAAAVSVARKALAALFNGRFDKHPTRAVTVYVFSSPDTYRRFCAARAHGPCPTRFGEYDRASRDIVMHATAGAETLNHELVHPIVQEDFPRAPAWLDEGIGALYENPVTEPPGYITGISNWRYRCLADPLFSPANPAPPTLDALFGMDTAAFLTTDPAALYVHYATARYFAQWLDSRGKLWPFYRAWRDGIALDRTGEKTFASVVGQTPAVATPAWAAWVRTLARPTDPPCPAP